MMPMWHTVCGDRVLVGKERSLFVHGAAGLLDFLLEDTDDEMTGVGQFDRLEPNVRVVLLRDVVQALTDPTVPMPELTAVNEAAVHAVFEFMRGEVGIEIECAHLAGERADFQDCDQFYWRRLVLAAYAEGCEPDDADDGEDGMSVACTDVEEWDSQLECLADQILWDRDWEMEEIMDASPEQARMLKRSLGIDEDYFLATPAEPVAGQVDEATAFLRRLVESDTRA